MSGRPPASSPVGSHAVVLGPALAITAAIHAGALRTFFALDDIPLLARAAGIEHPNGAFRILSEGLAFRLEYALFGLDPLGYHVVNLLLHLFNVAGVYLLSVRLDRSRLTGAAAAVLFGASSIAFTPLHSAVLGEPLACALLLGATLIHLASEGRSEVWRWTAALLALAAMFAKESAVAWVVVVMLIEWRSGRERPSARAVLPAAAVGAAFVLVFVAQGQLRRVAAPGAYASTLSPWFLAQNLSTYLRWCVALDEPIRDAVAAAEPGAWPVALPIALALGIALWSQRRERRHPIEIGLGWWLAFLLPVLPLMHHTYLYYLYVPWAGASIALAAIGRRLLGPVPRSRAFAIAALLLCVFVWLEALNERLRSTLTRDALPVDRTMRAAMLLSHALPALRQANLPPGTRVLFVNPVPRERFDLTTGAPTRTEDLSRRDSYFPLEAVMRDGETLRLFVPQVAYVGFASTIPPGLEDAECFYYEQRGWLERWGRGGRALLRQAEVQRAAQRWLEADTTLARVRALGDGR